MQRAIFGFLVAGLLAQAAAAHPAGERHLTATEASAALRDAGHSDQLRITVWYPAAADAKEEELVIGPPGKPIFLPGKVAPGASFADQRPRPVILFSHGFGGTARMMAWFGTALAREGYVVVAVDHPGNNAADPMTVGGATLFWERSGDLKAALRRVEADPAIAPHLDTSRLGVSGFSAGGFTSLAAAGARVDVIRFRDFCSANPHDGVCAPQKEFTLRAADAEAFLDGPGMDREIAKSREDLSVPGIKAAFVMAPALVQSFDPASLERLTVPVEIILGDADPVAPPKTNGEIAAAEIPGARIEVLPRVAHYDFLAECTTDGLARNRLCPTEVPRAATHEAAIAAARAFFAKTLGAPE